MLGMLSHLEVEVSGQYVDLLKVKPAGHFFGQQNQGKVSHSNGADVQRW